ncbi:protease modulator HflC [Ectothiorhodospiraceae bacterium BW-2]|nr:protease modulator HflC [Ectothiorhodospiraceae bacterium BW-2]
MEGKTMFKLIGVIVLLWLVSMSLFVVTERELAIKFQFGEFVRGDYEPGLHFKIPFFQKVRKFERRIMTIDSRPVPYLTLEKKNLLVDSFVMWRISDVGLYYRSMRGLEANATERLSKVIQEGLRNEFAKRTIQEAISGERAEIMRVISEKIVSQVAEFGLDVVDVRIKRIELPVEVSESVFQRMRAERQRVATELRSQGAEKAEKIRAEADRQRTVILAEAERDAQMLRGEGDGSAAAIYAASFGQDREFYEFYRSLEAYQQAFQSKDDMLLLDANTDFFRYFTNRSPSPAPVRR